MKAKHRHELHTNLLADRAWRLYQSLKGGPKANTSILAWVLILLALATCGLWYYSALASHSERSQQWLALGEATRDFRSGEAKLTDLAESAKGTIPGRTARFEIARRELQFGEENLRSVFNRPEAIKKLVEARKLYQELSKECLDSPLLTQEALMAVAKVEESLIGIFYPINQKEFLKDLKQSELDKLIKIYSKRPVSKAAQRVLTEIGVSNEQKNLDPVLKTFVDLAITAPDSPSGKAAATILDDVFDPDFRDKSLGSLDRAIQDYERLVKDFPESPLAEAAAKRLEAVRSDGEKVQEFYQELKDLSVSMSKQEPDRSPDIQAKPEPPPPPILPVPKSKPKPTTLPKLPKTKAPPQRK
jgi:hypothetical protein